MDINSVPSKVLEKTLSYLSYDQLKNASLVCRRWSPISEKLLTHKGKLCITTTNLGMIRDSTRSYRGIAIHEMDSCEQLLSVVCYCLERYPNIQELSLVDIQPIHLYQIYRKHPDCMKQCKSLTVSLRDESTLEQSDYWDLEKYTLALPNLTQLHWTDNCVLRCHTFTIDAPLLERVSVVSDSEFTLVKILHCQPIKHIWFQWKHKHFLELFTGDVGNVETLILHVYKENSNIYFLANIHQLQYLSLIVDWGTKTLQKVQSMSSKLLKFLSIRPLDGAIDHKDGTLDLEKIFCNYENLESLGLRGIHIGANSGIHAGRLKSLRLKDVAYYNRLISLNAPNLRSLSLDGGVLEMLRLNGSEHSWYLCLELPFHKCREPFEKYIFPFIEEQKNLKHLILKGNRNKPIVDDFCHGLTATCIEHLEMHSLRVSLEFFRSLARWNSLKNLKLIECIIDCGQTTYKVVRLPGVKWMTIDCVEVDDHQYLLDGKLTRSSKDFPILPADGVNENFFVDGRMFSTPDLGTI